MITERASRFSTTLAQDKSKFATFQNGSENLEQNFTRALALRYRIAQRDILERNLEMIAAYLTKLWPTPPLSIPKQVYFIYV